MTTRLVWTEQAVADLEGIREFIARDSPRYAEIVVLRLVEAAERLRQFPRSGRVVPELGREDVREVLWGTYRLVYRVAAEEAQVLTVFRASRLLPLREPPGPEPPSRPAG